jgi:hypothetical protein
MQKRDPSRRIRLATSACVAVFVSACGASGTPSTANGTLPPPNGTRNGTVPPSATPMSFLPPAHGILECVSGQLTIVDPSTGATTWSEPTTAPTVSGWMAAGCNGPHESGTPPYDLENFSTDLARVVAFEGTPASSAGSHVGWIDLLTGAVTDISAMTSPPPSFGGAQPTIDTNPEFDPGDNSFWFARTTDGKTAAVMRVSDGSSTASAVGTISYSDAWGISSLGTLVDVSDPYSPSGLPPSVNPRASVAVTIAGSGSSASGTQIALLPAGSWKQATISGPDATAFGVGSSLADTALQWLTDTGLICTVPQASGGSEIDLLTYTPGTTLLTEATLVSSNNATSSHFIASPGGSEIAFLSYTQGMPTMMYTIAAGDLKGQPTPIGTPLSDMTSLLAWR